MRVCDGGVSWQESLITLLISTRVNPPIQFTFDRIWACPIRPAFLSWYIFLRESSLVRVTMRHMFSSELFPVEPPHLREFWCGSIMSLKAASDPEGQGFFTHDCTSIFYTFGERYKVFRSEKRWQDSTSGRIGEEHRRRLWVHQARERCEPFPSSVIFPVRSVQWDIPNGVVAKTSGVTWMWDVSQVRNYGQGMQRVVTSVEKLSATEAARIEDRLGAFTTYGKNGDVALMEELFRLGCRFRYPSE